MLQLEFEARIQVYAVTPDREEKEVQLREDADNTVLGKNFLQSSCGD